MLLHSCVFFTVLLSCIGCSSSKEQLIEQNLQDILNNGIEIYNIRGVSAAIIGDENLVWSGTSGISHDTISMKPSMLFSIGSVTKNFVAALTLKLVEEDILTLEDSLSRWLPNFQYVDPHITIRQLLNHTSGIYMFWNNDDLWEALKKDRSKIRTPEEVLAHIKEPHFSPGESWRYSNTNYLLMAMIIEKATQSSLSNQFKKYFWEPLELFNYYLWLEDTIPHNQAHVFGDNFQFGAAESDLTFRPRESHESITHGSSGIVTNAEDLAKWCYNLFENDILTQASMNEMLQFVTFKPTSNMKGYGLGLQLFSSNLSKRERVIGHGGGNIGSATYMIHLPEYHTSVVVMVNAFPTRSIDYFARRIIKEIVNYHN